MTCLFTLLVWFGLADLKLQQQPQTDVAVNNPVSTGSTGTGGQVVHHD